jgi:hypothetical protein
MDPYYPIKLQSSCQLSWLPFNNKNNNNYYYIDYTCAVG